MIAQGLKVIVYSVSMVAALVFGVINIAAAVHGYNLPASLLVGVYDMLIFALMVAVVERWRRK